MAAEPRSAEDLARLLTEKAAGDEKILFRLIDEEDIPDDGLGFHAQQAVEKMIKAVLANNEVSYERTHNIAYLLELRYGRRPDAAPDRGQMRALVEQTKTWADAQLKGLYDEPTSPDSSAG